MTLHAGLFAGDHLENHNPQKTQDNTRLSTSTLLVPVEIRGTNAAKISKMIGVRPMRFLRALRDHNNGRAANIRPILSCPFRSLNLP